MSSSYNSIHIEKRGQVDWLTLNRPEAMNAISVEMVGELNDYFGKLYHDRDVRVVVMRGAGKAYCAGLDIKEHGGREPGAIPFGGGFGFQGWLADVYIKMRRCPQPIVSLVHGPACGGGFAFALASDIRIAGESARMNAAFIRIGLSACDIGVSYFLPRMVGASVAAEYMLTGRFIDAQRAYQLGLVSRISPPEDIEAEARSFAADMLHATPLGLRLTKEALGHAIDANSMEAVIAMEDRNQILCTRGEDFNEGIKAFFEKRAPSYAGR